MQPMPRYTGDIVHLDAKKMIIWPHIESGDTEPRRLFFANDIAPGMMEFLSQGAEVHYTLRPDTRFPDRPKLATDVRPGSQQRGAPQVDAATARAAGSATKTVGEFRGEIVHVDYEQCYGFIEPEPNSDVEAGQRLFLFTAFTSNSIRTPPPMRLAVTYSLQRDSRGPQHPDVAVNVAPQEDGAADTGSDVDALAAAFAGAGPVNDGRGVAAGFDRNKKNGFIKPSGTAPRRAPELMPQFPGVQYKLRANTHVPSRLR